MTGKTELRVDRQLVRETKRFAQEELFRTWRNLAFTVVPLAAAVFLTLLPIHWALRIPASILQGLLMVRLFVIYHDHMHGAILERSSFGSLLLRWWGILALAPPSIWKETHDHHHRNNAKSLGMINVGSYPVLTTTEYARSGAWKRFTYSASRHPLTIGLGYLTVFFYSFCIQPFFKSPRRHLDGGLSAAIHLSLLAVLFWLWPDVALLTVIGPWLLAAAMGSYLFYAQHNFPAAVIRADRSWDYVFAALRSSSFMRLSPVLHWFTANIGYHHVHHLNSRIPFYRLPEAMAAITELQSPGTTSLWPMEVIRCLRLKLWDPSKDRLVTYREAREQAAVPVSTAA